MKTTINKWLLAVTGSCLIMASCDKKIDDAHQNPNAPVKVEPEKLLPNMIGAMAANAAAAGPLSDNRFIGRYVQYYSINTALDQYERMGGTTGVSDNAGSLWRQHYYDFGQNTNRMMEWAAENQQWDYVGVGKALFAWSWLQLTDYHGEVILKEAFNTNLLTFKFDKEADVYQYVRDLCREAITYLNRKDGNVSQAKLAEGDAYFYNGDTEKWKKFVYAVMARSFHHLTNKSSYQPDSVIYYCNLSMQTAADDGMVKFAATGISGNANFFGPVRANIGAFRQTAYFTDLMAGRNAAAFTGVFDPRTWYMLYPNPEGTFTGLPLNRGVTGIANANQRPNGFWNQLSAVTAAPASDATCKYIFRNDGPMPIITASEVQFMKAEAALRKGDRTTALDAYRKGIRLNFDMLMTPTFERGVPDANKITAQVRDAYLANPTVVPPADQLTLSHIMLQKYIALFGWGTLETWVDMRRYHYTDTDPANGLAVYRGLTPPSGTDLFPDNAGKLVYRVRYRYNSEYVWNIDELRRLGADALDWHTKEVWFSTKE